MAVKLSYILVFSLVGATSGTLLNFSEELSNDGDLAEPSLTTTNCPPWFQSLNNDPNQCYCADTLKNIVQCGDRNTSYLRLPYCIAYDASTGKELVGACLCVS